MAVPSEAYQIYSLKDIIEGSVRQDFKFAKFTSPYTTLEEAKTLFRLDGAILEGTSSFIGYVNINSENSAYHSTDRTDIYIFSNKKLLTDAGLNRKAEKPVFKTISTISTSLDVSDNSVYIVGEFYSPYYNEITKKLKLANSDNLNVVSEVNLGNLVQNTTQTVNNGHFMLPDDIIINSENTYVLNLVSSTSEGDSVSTSLSITPLPKYKYFHYGTTLDLAIAATGGAGVYINRRLSDAVVADVVIFYAKEDKSSYANTGYYLSIDADTSGNYKFFRVTTSEGRVTEINAIVSRHQDIYYYYSPISAADAISGHSPSEIVLYYKVEITPPGDFENRTYYVSSFADAAYAAQGYYVKEDRETSIYVGENGEASVLKG